ncbi:hypothetical protein Syun_005232 [Stephania yunnanensis]|uniref:Uncharacterized protein n=1 Tax=Stephania yunnanensis TaxID=152371 RepID=A0AAP0L5D0_9MAGN
MKRVGGREGGRTDIYPNSTIKWEDNKCLSLLVHVLQYPNSTIKWVIFFGGNARVIQNRHIFLNVR